MKKIIAFSVLLVLLSAAVFAQDDSEWKIGFAAQLTRNFFYTTKATVDAEMTQSGNTGTIKLGEFIKGSSDFFTYTDDSRRTDNRLILSLTNSGEHHKIYIDAKLDAKVDDPNWLGGPSLMGLINGGAADWEFSGDTGAAGGSVVFDGMVGTSRYNGFVPVYELWDDWLHLAEWNFFGVQKQDGFLPSNVMSATAFAPGNPWSSVYALGATFGENFRFALGSTLDSFTTGFDEPAASASSVQGGFMFSGKNVADLLSFDLFYAIKGEDKNTAKRGTGKWENIIGAYVGLDLGQVGIDGLGVSLGGTFNFDQAETAEVKDGSSWKTVDITNPMWIGVDLKVKFAASDELGITFNNNFSLASAQGAEVKNPGDPIVNGLNGKPNTNKDLSESWFAWNLILGVNYALTDNLNVTLAVGNLLSVYTTDYTGTPASTISLTTDELRASVHAEYSAGTVTVGLGLNFGLLSDSIDSKKGSDTVKGSANVVKFSVPLFFKVAI